MTFPPSLKLIRPFVS